jgi:protein NirF
LSSSRADTQACSPRGVNSMCSTALPGRSSAATARLGTSTTWTTSLSGWAKLTHTSRGEQAWVSARDDDKVVVYDTASREVLREIKGDKPSGIFLAARANRIGQ